MRDAEGPGYWGDVGQFLCYVTIAAVIIACNREQLAGLAHDLRAAIPSHISTSGKLWDDVRDALKDRPDAV